VSPATEPSARLLELARYRALGFGHAETAAMMGISHHTADNERKLLWAMLRVASWPECWSALGWMKVPE